MKVWQTISNAVPLVIVLGILGLGWYSVHEMNLGDHEETETAVGETLEAAEVKLSSEKRKSVEITDYTVTEKSLQAFRQVAGRLDYDEKLHVEVKAPTSGILNELKIQPGDHVEVGDELAELFSPELGAARSLLLRRQEELELARFDEQRQSTIRDNLKLLVELLAQNPSMDQIKSQFSNKSLGEYRTQLVAGYSKVLLAGSLADAAKPLVGTGSVSGKTMRERDAELQNAEAEFLSARDEAVFAVERDLKTAQAAVAEAARQLELAKQSLDTLSGILNEEAAGQWTKESLSYLKIAAPIAGTIESLQIAAHERMEAGQTILLLADARSLYLRADLREQDWAEISLQPMDEIQFSVPAEGQESYTAKVHYLGRSLTTESNAIPLIAILENKEGHLRPGMFSRVSIPIGEPRSCLAVPAGAVMTHEGKSFVFLTKGDATYQKQDVQIGMTSGEWIEITQGLVAGQTIAVGDVFTLKSELLLEGEQ